MGHKVHPTGIRLGISKDWNSKWFAGKRKYAEYLIADLKVREMLRKKLAQAGISKIFIERPANNARVTIHTARPGVVIGKRGEDIDKLRKEVSDMMGIPAHINVTEVRKPELDAQLVSESIAQQLERRIMFRRAMKRAVGNAMRLGALGIKVNVGGRLHGGEIARSEWDRECGVPLYTGRTAGVSGSGNAVGFAEYGLKATAHGQLTARQIEAARRSISRYVKRGGKMWFRVFPDKPITKT